MANTNNHSPCASMFYAIQTQMFLNYSLGSGCSASRSHPQCAMFTCKVPIRGAIVLYIDQASYKTLPNFKYIVFVAVQKCYEL